MSRLSRFLGLPRRKPVAPTETKVVQGHEIGYFKTTTGNWWLPLIDDLIAITMRRGRIFEREVVKESAKHIRPGTAVLDVGSNFGQMAVLFSRMVGQKGKVHAFEADPFVCSLLRMNVEANKARNIIVHESAVWSESGKTLIYPVPENIACFGAYGIDPRASEGRAVISTAIDDLGIGNVSFIKIDIQGSDLNAINGAAQTIKGNRSPVLFEFEQQLQAQFGTSFRDYEEVISSLGYKIKKQIMGHNYLIVPTD